MVELTVASNPPLSRLRIRFNSSVSVPPVAADPPKVSELMSVIARNPLIAVPAVTSEPPLMAMFAFAVSALKAYSLEASGRTPRYPVVSETAKLVPELVAPVPTSNHGTIARLFAPFAPPWPVVAIAAVSVSPLLPAPNNNPRTKPVDWLARIKFEALSASEPPPLVRLSRLNPLPNVKLPVPSVSVPALKFPTSSSPAALRVALRFAPPPIRLPGKDAVLSTRRMLPMVSPETAPALTVTLPPLPAEPFPERITSPWLIVSPLCALLPLNTSVLAPTFVSRNAPLIEPLSVKLPGAEIPLVAFT